MKKYIITVVISLVTIITSNAQLKVTSMGRVGITNTNPLAVLDLGTGNGLTAPGGPLFLLYNSDNSGIYKGVKAGFYCENFCGNNLNLVFAESAAAPGLFTICGKNTAGTDLNSYFKIAGLTGNVGIGGDPTTEKLFVNGNSQIAGNLGLGVANPAYKLQVRGGHAKFEGYVGIGTAPGQNYAALSIDGGTGKGINLSVSHSFDWGHSMTSFVTRQNTLSYVVTYGNNNTFYVFGNGMIYSGGSWIGSDSILKKNIVSIPQNAINKLYKLKGKNYDFKRDSDNISPRTGDSKSSSTFKGHHFGFLAQDVEKEFPEIVANMNDGTKAVNYIELIPFMIEALKAQSKTIDSLNNKSTNIDALQSQIATLTSRLTDLQNCCNTKSGKLKSDEVTTSEASISSPILTSGLKLYQNAPNPFKESTTIKLEIPQSVSNAMVCIYDLNGRQLKCLTLGGRGTTSVQIFGNELTAGMYHYALIADGALVDTKTMVLTE